MKYFGYLLSAKPCKFIALIYLLAFNVSAAPIVFEYENIFLIIHQ